MPIGTDQVDVFPAHLHQFAKADRQHDKQTHRGGNAAVVAVIPSAEIFTKPQKRQSPE
jgi:hypothetical protein